MAIPVKYLNFNEDAPDSGYWDQYLLSKIFSQPEFKIVSYSWDKKKADSAIVIVAGRQNVDNVKHVNEYIEDLKGVLLIISGDEESNFPVNEIKHPNMNLWVMTPQAGRNYPNVDRFIGEGYTPHMELLPNEYPEKTQRWFFAGQVTHPRRVGCVEQLRAINSVYNDGDLVETKAFAGGLERDDYVNRMARARVIPCAGGPATPDTFRLYEALESGCIPIADNYSAINQMEGYWQMLYGDDIPFPIIKDWNELPDLINFFNDTFEENSNKIFAWWQLYKRNLALEIIKDYGLISDVRLSPIGITAIVPTSPTISNPDISIIEETIRTIKEHLPDIEIFITFDGVREEQKHLSPQYQEYVSRLLWKCNREWKHVVPIVFGEHMHQVAMAREVLKHVTTDQILYVEHDTPLTPDLPIEWENIYEMIHRGYADLVRFHFESFIPKDHEYMMLDKEPQIVCDTKAIRTFQWSQRPHLASKKFYERILEDHFTREARTFIEDKMHSVVHEAYKREQLQGWNKYRLWIYHPEGNIKRSYHLDGRGDEQKYSMKF